MYIFLSQISPLNAYEKKRHVSAWLEVFLLPFCRSSRIVYSAYSSISWWPHRLCPVGKAANRGKFSFPTVSTTFPCACAIKGISWDRVLAVTLLSSIYLCCSEGCPLHYRRLWQCGDHNPSHQLPRGRVGFAKRPCPRVLCGKGFSEA